MTLSQLATGYCANCHNGICTGTQTNLDGTQSRFLPEGSSCLLFGATPSSCAYLEEYVAPMAGWTWKNPREGALFGNAIAAYRIRFAGERPSDPAIRRCPDCRNNTVGPRQRYCEECKIRRRRTTMASAKRKRRAVQQLTKNGH